MKPDRAEGLRQRRSISWIVLVAIAGLIVVAIAALREPDANAQAFPIPEDAQPEGPMIAPETNAAFETAHRRQTLYRQLPLDLYWGLR